MNPLSKPLRPAEHAESQLLDAILSNRFPPGNCLPAERVLAESLGVTRPTLREALQRLSREGWITIRHGKPSLVNDYLNTGGLGLLCSMVRHANELSHEMIGHLLEVRSAFFPGIAALAVERDSQALLRYLENHPIESDDPGVFSAFDWGLQVIMVTLTENPFFKVIINDFSPMYREIGRRYFEIKAGRHQSCTYYAKLAHAVENDQRSVPEIVKQAMKAATITWEQEA